MFHRRINCSKNGEATPAELSHLVDIKEKLISCRFSMFLRNSDTAGRHSHTLVFELGFAACSVTSFKVQEEPAIAEVEVGVVTVLVHQLKELGVQDLQRWRD